MRILNQGVVALEALCLIALLTVGAVIAERSEAAFPGQPGRIVYVHSPGMMQANIWSINPDGTGAAQLTTDSDPETNPVWSYDGQRVAFTRPAPNQDVFVMGPSGENPVDLTSNSVVDQGPSFFPDGRIAYMSASGPGATFEIWVMNGDGSNKTPITNNTVNDVAPAVSPDGSKIAFERFDGTDIEIHVMNADGSGVVQLTHDDTVIQDSAPTWSPDGRRISWHRSDGTNVEVMIMNADGSSQTPIVSSPATETSPAFAPDNSRLLFARSAAGVSNVFALGLMPAADAVPVTSSGRDSEPDWQPIPVTCRGLRATIVGTPSDDVLTGTASADVISGQDGRDRILGLQGKDRLCGDAGRDKLVGGPGKDRLGGGPGKDKLLGGKGKDNCAGGKGRDNGKSCERGKL